MNRLCAGVLALIVLITMPDRAFADDAAARVFDAPRLDHITIDGKSDDWGDSGLRVDLLTDQYGRIKAAEDFDACFRLGWDERGLLVLVCVRDDRWLEDADIESLWARDGVELFIATEPGSRQSYQICIGPGVTAGQAAPRWKAYVHDPKAVARDSLAVEIARTHAGDRYVMEVLLPWKNLQIQPEPGRIVGFQIYVNDSDDPLQAMANVFHACWFPIIGAGSYSSKMYRVRLAEKAEPRSLIVACGCPVSRLPRVLVAGPPQWAGKPVEARKDGRTLAAGILAPDAGRAFAELCLPYPPFGQPIGRIEVLVDGKPERMFDLPQVAEPQLVVTPIEEARPDGATTFTVDFSPAGDAAPGVMAGVEAFDLAGRSAGRTECAFKGKAALKLNEGFYRLTARIGDFHGRALEGGGACCVGANPRAAAEEMVKRARAALAAPALAEYAGGLRYLADDIERRLGRDAAGWPRIVSNAVRMGECLDQAGRGADPLARLRGVKEWAYTSKVDGSSQPFMIGIPHGYDPARKYSLHVHMHGHGGVHGEAESCVYDQPFFTVWVLGRTRVSGYRNLAEVDVLEATDYVMSHWSIDPDRVHVEGGSMGGGGTYKLATRHPDRFASARSECGYGLESPLENLLHVPTCALHSRDDLSVSVMADRAPIRYIAENGGRAIMDETYGYGHTVHYYQKGVEQSLAWAERQVRPSRVRRVRYSAQDEFAAGAYWVRVSEWGPEGRPARVDAQVGADNGIYLTLDNVNALRLDLASCGIARGAESVLSVNGRIVQTLAAPLPDALYVVRSGEGWQALRQPPAAPAFRLHFPGGAQALYHGEPLMIVWGTQGAEPVCKAICDVAQGARRGCHPAWPRDREKRGGIPAEYMPYATLPGKADTDVTPEDMTIYNLVLIGTAQQNALVARMADRLPVRIQGGRAVADDGSSWDMKDRALGLLYFNPLAPKRLIFWAASDSAAFYRAGSPLMDSQSGWDGAPPDFSIMNATEPQFVAARRFDSRWKWERGYGDSPLATESAGTNLAAEAAYTEAIRLATGANLALMELPRKPQPLFCAPGETRLADLVALEYSERLALMDLTGREIADCVKTLEAARSGCRFVPEARLKDLVPGRSYSVAMRAWTIAGFCDVTQNYPASYRLTDITLREALLRNLKW